MAANTQTHEGILDRICSEVIGPEAAAADRDGAFPGRSIQALARAGLMGTLSAPECGGLGLGLRAAAGIVERVAQECGSTAMVLTMHYCGAVVLEAHGSDAARRAAASGQELTTLAFSEAGTRSHFWAPTGTARLEGGDAVLDGRKTFVTSASRAATYVWSSKPVRAEGLSTLWLVPADARGLTVHGPFEGLGLRGNDSAPVTAEGVRVTSTAMLGADGKGFDIMMATVLPVFQVLSAACSAGLMEAAVRRTAEHAAATRHADSGSPLSELPTIRAYIARMRIKADMCRTLIEDTVSAIESKRPDAMLRVLEVKASAGETAGEVLDLAMRVCGGAAYRKEVGVERYFRDGRAAGIMAPTTDVLYDFIGKSVCGMPLF